MKVEIKMAVEAPTKFSPNEGSEWVDWIYRKPAHYRTQGRTVFPLLISPRDEPAEHVLEASQQAAGHNAHIDERGTEQFRAAISTKLRDELDVKTDPDTDIIATNGGLNATFIALAGILRSGDEVIVPTPQFYYWNAVKALNAVAVMVPMRASNDWAWEIDAIEAAVTSRTRAILYTNPCNPTGFAPSVDQMAALGEVADRHNLLLVEDQAYEKFTHTIPRITSAGSMEGLRDRTIISYSFHKNYSLHGWRAGFLAGPGDLIQSLLSVAIWVNLRVNHITQAAATAALEGPQDWVDEVVRPYREGRTKLEQGLTGSAITVDVPVMAGTMGYLRVDELGLDSTQAAEALLRDYGVTTVPGACFGEVSEPGEHVRIAFALARDYPDSFDAVVAALQRAADELGPTGRG